MSILLAVERDTPCTSILLAVEGDTPGTSILLVVEGYTLHASPFCWLWKWLHPGHSYCGRLKGIGPVRPAGCGRGDTLYVHTAGRGRGDTL
jgi:hypothetical protein